MNRVALLLLGTLMTTPLARAGDASTDKPDLAGVTLDNGRVFVQLVPDLGRIFAFGESGGRSLLWTPTVDEIRKGYASGEYANFGGDKVWPTLQALWPRLGPDYTDWPPPGVVDGPNWKLVASDRLSATMQSPIDSTLSIRVTRTVRLVEGEPRVVIENTVERLEANPLPVHVWTITEVVHPDYALLDVAADQPAGEAAYVPMRGDAMDVTELKGAVRWAADHAQQRKIGTFGRWIAAVFGGTVFLQHADYQPGAMYLDRSSIQIYDDENFTELETLSPSVHLEPGRTIRSTVTWELLEAPDAGDPAKLAARLDRRVADE